MFLDVCLPPHAGPWFCIPIGCAGSRVHAAGSDQGSRQANLQLQLEHFPLLIFQVQQLAIVALRRRRFQMLKKNAKHSQKKTEKEQEEESIAGERPNGTPLLPWEWLVSPPHTMHAVRAPTGCCLRGVTIHAIIAAVAWHLYGWSTYPGEPRTTVWKPDYGGLRPRE